MQDYESIRNSTKNDLTYTYTKYRHKNKLEIIYIIVYMRIIIRDNAAYEGLCIYIHIVR